MQINRIWMANSSKDPKPSINLVILVKIVINLMSGLLGGAPLGWRPKPGLRAHHPRQGCCSRGEFFGLGTKIIMILIIMHDHHHHNFFLPQIQILGYNGELYSNEDAAVFIFNIFFICPVIVQSKLHKPWWYSMMIWYAKKNALCLFSGSLTWPVLSPYSKLRGDRETPFNFFLAFVGEVSQWRCGNRHFGTGHICQDIFKIFITGHICQGVSSVLCVSHAYYPGFQKPNSQRYLNWILLQFLYIDGSRLVISQTLSWKRS